MDIEKNIIQNKRVIFEKTGFVHNKSKVNGNHSRELPNMKEFKTWPVRSHDEIYFVSIETGTRMGFIPFEKKIATMQWRDDQADIGSTLIIVGLDAYGRIIDKGQNIYVAGFLLYQDNSWNALTYNPKEKLYEFLPIVKDSIEFPSNLPDCCAFSFNIVYPTVNKEGILKYGDVVFLLNETTENMVGHFGGSCVENKYPLLSEHKLPKTYSGIHASSDIKQCFSGNCFTSKEQNAENFCGIYKWQILPISSSYIDPFNSPKIGEKKISKMANNLEPTVFYWAFIPIIFFIILFVVILLYRYF